MATGLPETDDLLSLLPNTDDITLPGGEDERKKLQSNIRRKATRISLDLDNQRKAPDDLFDAEELEWLIETAESHLNQLLSYKNQAEEVDKPTAHIEKLQASLFKAKARLRRWNEERRLLLSSPRPSVSPNLNSSHQESPTSSAALLAKLAVKPPDIPRFDPKGDVPWHKFWKKFNNVIGSRDYFTDDEKIDHLLGLLDGAAKHCVDGLSTEGDNYDVVVKRLKARFDHSDERQKTLLNKLYDFPRISIETGAKARSNVDSLMNILEELEILGKTSDELEEILQVRYDRILPQSWIDRWKRLRQEGRKLNFRQFVENEATVIYDASKSQTQPPRQAYQPRFPNQTPRPQNPPQKFPTSHHLVAGARSYNPQQGGCKACNSTGHSILRCPVFIGMAPAQRSNLLKTSKLCMNCTGPHFVKDCTSNFSCKHCGRRHHSMTCQPPTSKPPANPTMSAPPVNATLPAGHLATPPVNPTVPVGNHATPPANPTLPPVANYPSTSRISAQTNVGLKNVFQKTALALLESPDGRTRVVRIMFDGGSDVSYCRSNIAVEFNLPVLGSAIFACTGFMETVEQPQSRNLVHALLKPLHPTVGHPVLLELWQTNTLCAPLPAKVFPPEVFPAMNGLYIADNGSGGEVDILIGADQYYQVLGDQIQVTETLRAFDSAFGYVLHGKGSGPCPVPQVRHMRVEAIQMFSDLETLGIANNELEVPDNDPSPYWSETEKKIIVPLLWRDESRPANNRASAAKRLYVMTSRMPPEVMPKYQEYIAEGLRERKIDFSPAEWSNRPDQFFLPHRAKPGKFAVVFDGSAKDGNGISLNSYLDPGPNRLAHLFDIIIRLRCNEVAFSADCKAAFPNLRVDPSDQPFLNFCGILRPSSGKGPPLDLPAALTTW